tara:strand:+ start:237 stop:680 length:444 start_codon:yes stop_codon:yes gene_type:complete
MGDKKKVKVSKIKKNLKHTDPFYASMGLVGTGDIKSKRVSEKRAGRMEKRGWTKESPMYKKSKQRVEQDYARNAIHDYETGHKSAGDYEKKKELEVAAGEGYFSSADKVHRHRRSAATKKGKVHFDSTTDKGIKGLGSSNKSGGRYI